MKKKERKFRGKLIALLNVIMLFALVAVPTYAFFWNRSEEKEIEVELGVEETLTIEECSWKDGSENKVLIPQEATETHSKEVKEIFYIVKLKRNNYEVDSYKAKLVVNHDINSLYVVSFSINLSEYNNEEEYTVEITIKLIENITKAEFASLSEEKNLKFYFSLEYEN